MGTMTEQWRNSGGLDIHAKNGVSDTMRYTDKAHKRSSRIYVGMCP